MPLGTQRLPVSRFCASGSPKPRSGELSSHVPPRPPPSPSVASLCATFSFNFVRSPRLRTDSPAISYLDPGVSRRTWRFALHRHRHLEEQRRFPSGSTGFRPCLCPHRTLFLYCRCAKWKLVGASKAQCSGRCPLPHRCRELDRRFPGWLLEEAQMLTAGRSQHGGVAERRQQATSIEGNTRRLHPSPACAHLIP